ncbi:hypothetical protein GCM10010350_75920 [Streptomyces galilaeus]|nr:hypothetical protein GCM10010350_75920 [Streptomyces galilaeus]
MEEETDAIVRVDATTVCGTDLHIYGAPTGCGAGGSESDLQALDDVARSDCRCGLSTSGNDRSSERDHGGEYRRASGG